MLIAAAWFASLALAVPVAEPLTPVAGAASRGLVIADSAAVGPPVRLRLESGYLPEVVDASGAGPLRLVYSSIGASAQLSPAWGVDGAYHSVVLIGDSRASLPDSARVQVRFAPPALAGQRLSLGFHARGAFGADLKRDTPGFGVGSSGLGASLAGSFGPVVVALESTVGVGTTRRPPDGRVWEVPIEAGALAAVSLGGGWARAALEAALRTDARQSQPTEILSALHVAVPLSETLELRVAGTGSRLAADRWVFGGLVALSGSLGLGDADSDGVEDAVDACPGMRGPQDNFGCPFEDADNDGVWDRLDACPTQPGPASNAGCPLKDTDNDKIPDIDDPCPTSVACPAG